MVCFKEGTYINTEKGNIKIEDLKIGDRVKTLNDGYKRITLIGSKWCLNSYDGKNVSNNMFVISKVDVPSLTEDLYVTGLHPFLMDEENENNSRMLARLGWKKEKTDSKYRVLACNYEKAKVIKKTEEVRIWNLVLYSNSRRRNYGIYANGLLTESMDEYAFVELSGLSCSSSLEDDKKYDKEEACVMDSDMMERHMKERDMKERHMKERHMKERHMIESGMMNSDMMERHMKERHMIESGMMDSDMIERHMKERHMIESGMMDSDM